VGLVTYLAAHVGAVPNRDPFAGINIPTFLFTSKEAVCAVRDPELWFPPPGSRNEILHAQELCRVCPLVEGCREYAIENEHLDGIWGATTPRQRKRIRLARIGERIDVCKRDAAGTTSGYGMHRRRGELACKACLAAVRIKQIKGRKKAAA